jgi:hypothetical protein
MKSIKIAGLCLVSMFAMSMAFSTSAFAGWEQCTKGVSGVLPTKWTNHLCNEAASSNAGEWEWREVNGTEAVIIKGSLLLKDTKASTGSEVECYGEGKGVVGPKTLDRIEAITVVGCRAIKVCEAGTATATAVNLPWQTEVYQTEGKKLESLTEGVSGSGKRPGWAVTCKVPILGNVTDTCTAEGPESLLLENKGTKRGASNEIELLVLATFQHLRIAECSIGGPKAGLVEGSVAILKTNGWGLRVT